MAREGPSSVTAVPWAGGGGGGAFGGVFDFLSRQGQVGEPASGQPQPCCFGQQLLFDEFVPSEPGSIGVVFDLLYTWIE
jgi:hypothetical protein